MLAAFFPAMKKGARGMPSGASPPGTDALWDRPGCSRTAEDRKSHHSLLSRAPLLSIAVSSVSRPHACAHIRALARLRWVCAPVRIKRVSLIGEARR
jgi:hypothetical protein